MVCSETPGSCRSGHVTRRRGRAKLVLSHSPHGAGERHGDAEQAPGLSLPHTLLASAGLGKG